ncbi:MAG TPA: peptide deformylase [Candidatus Latescibacteria bacterium]|nr:peptide deformylase [Candidatus Latescibacterota bacterium]
MALLPIRIYGDPVLRRVAEPVREFTRELQTLATDMIETMYAEPGVGLAAPQVGVSIRMIVIDPTAGDEKGKAFALINPVVTRSGEHVVIEEGCLSVPDIRADVVRPERVSVDYQTIAGEPAHLDADDMVARIIQHEYDHLDGILFVDRISPVRRQLLRKQLKALAKSQGKRS